MRRRAVRAVLAVLACIGVCVASPVAAQTSHPHALRAHAAGLVEGVGRFRHVVVLTEENESAATTWASTSPAVYLRSLRSKGVFLPNYYGTGHVSLDNYIAMVSGQVLTPLTASDCLAVSLWTCVQGQSVQRQGLNLGDQLEAAGLSWRAYADGATTRCFHGPYKVGDLTPDPYQGDSTTGAKNFADRHNPFLYFPDIIGNATRCAAHQRPIADLATDIAANRLPAFSFITPDTCHDGHDNPCAGSTVGGLTTADAWLRATLPNLLTYLAANNGLLVINFDEGSVPPSPTGLVTTPTDYLCTSCVSLGIGGRTGALLISPRLPQGAVVTTGYDHYSLLRTIEDSFGIGQYLNMAAFAHPMTAAFAGLKAF